MSTGSLATSALLLAAIAFVAIATVVLYRAYRGPTIQDRVLAVNVAGTNTVVVLAVVAVIFDLEDALDVAIVYAFLNFVVSMAVARFAGRGGE